MEGVEGDEVLGVGLDGVQRRDHPGGHPRPARRVAGRQRLGPGGQMQHDSAGLEHLDLVVAVGRTLAKGLPLAIALRRLDGRVDQGDGVIKSRLLQRPADAQVANVALGEGRNPGIGRYGTGHGRLSCCRQRDGVGSSAAGAATIYPPWFPFWTQDGSGNYQANFYAGTVGGIVPSNMFTPVALTQNQVNYLYLACTASGGIITAATITASTTYPTIAASTSGAPPTSFNIPIGIFDLTGSAPVLHNIVGFGNIWVQPYVSLLTTAVSPTVLSAPFTVTYNWEWGAGN